MKIFLAGTYSEQKNFEDLSKSKYNLESFYYFKPWQLELIKTSTMFLLDSGAYTFMQNSKSHVVWEDYLERYADFINKSGIQYFFELDIDSIVGYDKVLEFRRRLEYLTGKQPIPVWHTNRGKEEFVRSAQEYPYVALGGLVGTGDSEYARKYWKYFPWFIKAAHENNAQIHALGFTAVEGLKTFHFDSVDSTRWNCARFGRLEYFDGRTIRAIDRRKYGKKLVGRKNNDILKFTFQEWVKFQKYAETHL
jgi:hypothetical protein